MMNASTRSRFDELLAMLRAPPAQGTTPRWRLTAPDDAAELIVSSGIGVSITPEEALRTHAVDYFDVVEGKMPDLAGLPLHHSLETLPEDLREEECLRPIMWPRQMLATSQYDSEFSLHTLRLIRMFASKYHCGTAHDAKCAYYHVASGGVYSIKTHSGAYVRIDRMLFGQDMAAEIMQLVMETLAGLPSRACNPFAGFADGTADAAVHIDNVVCAASATPVAQHWRSFFTARCAAANITLNTDRSNRVSKTLQICGVVLDFKDKTTWLGNKAMARLRDIRHICVPHGSNPHNWTAHQLQSVYGRLAWCAAALGADPAADVPTLFLLKTVRRLCSKLNRHLLSPTSIIQLPLSAQLGLTNLFTLVSANTPSPVTGLHPSWSHESTAPFEVVLTTDATPTSFGMVLSAPGDLPTAYGGRFDEELPIETAETAAVYIACEKFADRLSGRRVLIQIDNTSALAAFRGSAKAEHLRFLAAKARELLPGDTQVTLQYVPSALNIADGPSRVFAARCAVPQGTMRRGLGTSRWGGSGDGRAP
jgi:hypothetical protein